MALIFCRQCGNQVSDQAAACPKCGAVISSPQQVLGNTNNKASLNGYQYFIKCWQQYADFDGRARRKEYWYFILFHLIFYYAATFIGGAIIGFILGAQGYDSYTIMQSGAQWGQIAGGIYIIAALLPGIAVGIRRMHDIGKSGWFMLIPIYNLILACTDSEPDTNEYGENPKGTN